MSFSTLGSLALSPSPLIAGTHEDNNIARPSGYARTADTTVVREKSKDQILSDASLVVILLCRSGFLTLHFRQKLGLTIVASVRPRAQTSTEHDELDEHMSEKTQQVGAVETWASETKKSDRLPSPAGPQLSVRRPYTSQYVVRHDDAGGRDRGFVSTPGTHAHDFENAVVQSSHSDMIQTQQPCKEDNIFDDANVVSRPVPGVPR